MAAGAIVAHGLVVEVGMARGAVEGRAFEAQILVAGSAAGQFVGSFERKMGFAVMVEPQRIVIDAPARRAVALFTADPEIRAVRRLGRDPSQPEKGDYCK